MFTLLMSFLTGVIGPLLPNVIGLIRDYQDRKHELAMLELRMKHAEKEHMWRIEELNATADIEEAKVLHTPVSSYGVQLIDAADKWGDTTWGKWLITPSFYMYSFLDILNGLVRPTIAYCAFGFYMVYKWSIFEIAQAKMATNEAILATWTENDWAVLLMVLGFFFGQRAAKAVLGGSTMTAKSNG
jgi:hypothetical protein